MTITAERYHDISCGHRVVGHESKCRYLHGHNYRITFTLQACKELDQVGRVLDFGVIKSIFCEWLEKHWDHKLLLWEEDPLAATLRDDLAGTAAEGSVVTVPFNPTAENIAEHLLMYQCPLLLSLNGTGQSVEVVQVKVEETRKCSAVARL